MLDPRLMNNWRVTLDEDEDEDGNLVTCWVVNHYVGGEHAWYLDNWYSTEAEANARRDYLNSNPIYFYTWVSDGDGNNMLRIKCAEIDS